ncbi:MAG: DUF4870 domain-containing protein [Acidimicrobiia bacterium]
MTTHIETTAESRNWAVIGHLSAFIQFIGIPAVIGPLVVWLIRKDQNDFSTEQAKEALNFNISMMLWLFLSAFAILILIGIVLLPVLLVTWFVVVIIAAIRASDGEAYRYPLTIRFIS